MGSAPKPQPLPPLPPPAADLTDEAVRNAQASARNQQLSGAGRRGTFLTAGGGSSAPNPGTVTTTTDQTARAWDYGLPNPKAGPPVGGNPDTASARAMNQRYNRERY
jgi:hypothetical protein